MTDENDSDEAWEGRTGKRHRAEIRKIFGFREPTVAHAEEMAAWLRDHAVAHNGDPEYLATALKAHCRSHPTVSIVSFARRLTPTKIASVRVSVTACRPSRAPSLRLCYNRLTVKSMLKRQLNYRQQRARPICYAMIQAEPASKACARKWPNST